MVSGVGWELVVVVCVCVCVGREGVGVQSSPTMSEKVPGNLNRTIKKSERGRKK